MGKKKFKIEVSVDDSFISVLDNLAKNDGYQSIDDWITSETNQNIYEIINENLESWGYDKYGSKINDMDEFGNQYDCVGELVAY